MACSTLRAAFAIRKHPLPNFLPASCIPDGHAARGPAPLCEAAAISATPVGRLDALRPSRPCQSIRRPLKDSWLHVAAALDVRSEVAVIEDDVIVEFPQTPLLLPYTERDGAEVLLSQHESQKELGIALAEYIADIAQRSVQERGLFTIALDGGSLVQFLDTLTAEPFLSRIDWSKWHVLWVNERFVRHSSPDSNFCQAADALLSKVPIPEDQILPTQDELPSVEEWAQDYDALLRELVGEGIFRVTKGTAFPRFDLILLGIGPEGHTASLFPNNPILYNSSQWVLPVPFSPKAPPQRVTMSLPVINSARNVAFIATGQGKAEVVNRVLERTALPGSLPAQLVCPYEGTLTWFLDAAAASQLSMSDWSNAKKYPFVKLS